MLQRARSSAAATWVCSTGRGGAGSWAGAGAQWRTRHGKVAGGLRQSSSAASDPESFMAGDGFSSASPQSIPTLLMEALRRNDFPEVDSGLAVAWDVFGDSSKYIFQHNYTDFVECAHETADEV